MTAKIEPWMLDAGRQVNEWTQKMPTGWKPTALEIAAIIGAHAPKETGINPDNATPIKLKDGFECTLIDVVVKDYNRCIRNKGKKP